MLKKILVLTDLHAPSHSEDAYSLFLKVAHRFKPDVLVCIGDFADFDRVSSYTKDPTAPPFLQEVLAVNNQLDRLDAVPAKRKIFCEGNHCKRLDTFLKRQAPELYGIVSVPELLDLEKRRWEFHPHQVPVEVGKMYFVHDLGYSGKNAIRQNLGDLQGNLVSGHTHRFSSMIEGNLRGESHVASEYGWLGDPERVDYQSKPKVKRDWHHGFGYGYQLPNGNTFMVPAPIINGKVLIDGEVVT